MSRSAQNWSSEEDNILLQQMSPTAPHPGDWAAIATLLPGRSNKDCRKRWNNHLAHGLKKGPWQPDEDQRLRGAIERIGKQWPHVAKEVGSRSADQCAKRWEQALNPDLNREQWTTQEDRTLLEVVKDCGTSWKTIQTQFFPKRSTNMIKNRFTTLTRFQNRGRGPSNAFDTYDIITGGGSETSPSVPLSTSRRQSLLSLVDSTTSSDCGQVCHGSDMDDDTIGPSTQDSEAMDWSDMSYTDIFTGAANFDLDNTVSGADTLFQSLSYPFADQAILNLPTSMPAPPAVPLVASVNDASDATDVEPSASASASSPDLKCYLTIQNPSPKIIKDVVHALLEMGASFNMEMR